jgi:hypothetical protein
MNANLKIFLLCPVPENQKPINEYIDLKENFLLNWTTFDQKNYFVKFFSFYLFWFSLVFLLTLDLSFKHILSNLLWSLGISLSLQNLMVFFFFLRWKEMKKRFNQARLFYEESSWFDGQIWEKPFFLIKNDQLIATQKIEPILKRLQKTLFYSSFLNILFFLLFSFLNFL